MQAQCRKYDGGDADRGTDDAEDQPHQTECMTANFLFHRGCLLFGTKFFVQQPAGAVRQQRMPESEFCYLKNKHGRLLSEYASLLFKDKQFAENIIGEDHNDLTEQLYAHGPQLGIGCRKADCRPQHADAQPDDELIHDHGGDAAGYELAELRKGRLALVGAFEHESPVCPISKEDTEDIVQHIAEAGRKIGAERRLKDREHHQIQKRCHAAEEEVGQTLVIFFDEVFEFLHGFSLS